MKKISFVCAICATGIMCLDGLAAVPFVGENAMRSAALRDVRLMGKPAEKMQAFFERRILSENAQRDIFGEARAAFCDRSDDELIVHDGKKVGGIWRGEFWGKLMLGAARVADYLQDPALTKFIGDECHRLMQYQDEDGYLGSYSVKENVWIPPEARASMKKVYGWNTVWNIWNRKYAMWAMLMAYKTTGDKTILESTERQMDQLIDMMHKLNLPLHMTGQTEMYGLPSMSILKPLLMLYTETGKTKYLDYAKEMIPYWDRDDGARPNFLRNANRTEALHTWYEEPFRWSKAYEMLSCWDGLLEYYRVTGDKRVLDAVIKLRDNLNRTELNVLGSAGYCDRFYDGAGQPNAATEVCDVIHWIRLNLDLFLITGDKKYCDSIELAYFNAFMAGVYRDGTWSMFFVRGATRHNSEKQCGYAYSHCCANNVPRTWMDVAEGTVTADAMGEYHVNFYQDAKVTLDGITFDITGNYPVSNVVRVKTSKAAKLNFRKPAWCRKLDIVRSGNEWVLTFDMNDRVAERPATHTAEKSGWHFNRYQNTDRPEKNGLQDMYRTTPAATVWHGPLLLAKCVRTGARRQELLDMSTINGKGYSVKLTPSDCDGVWGAWNVELSKPGEPTIKTKACDFQSAADDPFGARAVVFSVWF